MLMSGLCYEVSRTVQREAARRKGPDLAALAELHGRAQALGAQEAMLTTHDGVLVEGATSSVIWWDATGALPDAPSTGEANADAPATSRGRRKEE
jgi:branched-subunit amino acid aminotransferase/4-amino-4-deoxychorismate lyase